MTRAILISIQPKWVEKILNGEKTIEIRKTFPKCKLPIDVYIYCTKDPKHLVAPFRFKEGWKYKEYNDNTSYACGCTANMGEDINGKVVAKFTLNNIDDFYVFTDGLIQYWIACDLEKSCVPYDDLANYIGKGKKGYAWNIDDLEIFDTPKELSEFKIPNPLFENVGMFGWAFDDEPRYIPIKKAPQSWCYVEVKE